MSLPPFDLDLSELQDRKFQCLDGCALCCLCQPELLEGEVPYFRRHYPERLVAKRQPHRHFALAMKKRVGSCSFLEDRRCQIYQVRPHYCRQFPFHIYVGTRVQVELDLSCRGVWTGKGEEALPIGARQVRDNERTVRLALDEAEKAHRQFFQNCLDMQIECRPDALRSDLLPNLGDLADLSHLASLLEHCAEEERVDLRQVRRTELTPARQKELEEAAWEAAKESLGAPDPFDAPIHCDAQGKWNIYRREGESLERYVIQDNGELEHVSSIGPSALHLRSLQGPGKDQFRSYLAMLNRRDSILGNSYHLMHDYNYEDHLSNLYYGVLATSALDLLWRSTLLAHVNGGKLDAEGIREGIIYFDMDRLDAPTLGGFL